MSEPLLYCKDCKYYSNSVLNLFKFGQREVCKHPASDSNVTESAIRGEEARTLVKGGPIKELPTDFTSCRLMRKYDCGFEAKLFVGKT